MRRLIVAPLVVGPVAGAAVAVWVGGLVWPIANTVWSVIAPRPNTAETEADPI